MKSIESFIPDVIRFSENALGVSLSRGIVKETIFLPLRTTGGFPLQRGAFFIGLETNRDIKEVARRKRC